MPDQPKQPGASLVLQRSAWVNVEAPPGRRTNQTLLLQTPFPPHEKRLVQTCRGRIPRLHPSITRVWLMGTAGKCSYLPRRTSFVCQVLHRLGSSLHGRPTLLPVGKRCSFLRICPNTSLPPHTRGTLCSFPGSWQPAKTWPRPRNVTLRSPRCDVVLFPFCLHVSAEQGQNSQRGCRVSCVLLTTPPAASGIPVIPNPPSYPPAYLQLGTWEKPCWLRPPSCPLREEFPPQRSAAAEGAAI